MNQISNAYWKSREWNQMSNEKGLKEMETKYCTSTQKERVDISEAHNEEIGLREFATHDKLKIKRKPCNQLV